MKCSIFYYYSHRVLILIYRWIFVLFKLVILNMVFHCKPIHLSSFMSLNIEVFTMVKHHLKKIN